MTLWGSTACRVSLLIVGDYKLNGVVRFHYPGTGNHGDKHGVLFTLKLEYDMTSDIWGLRESI